MEARFDVNDVRKLSFNVISGRCTTIEMDVDEGWLYISMDTIDDWNRTIDYSCTFPLDEWMSGEVRRALKEGEVPSWKTGKCQYMSRVCSDSKWDLLISTPGKEFGYSGWDAFPKGYDRLNSGLDALAISLFHRFKFNIDDLSIIHLGTDDSLNNDSFSLSANSLNVRFNDGRGSMDTTADHLEDIKIILKDYLLRPDEPKRRCPMEHGKCIKLSLMDGYGDRLCLWWGEDRPAWVDDMVQRLYDALKAAYRDARTVAKPVDPFLPREPEKYFLSDGTKKIVLDELERAEGTLPIEQSSFMDVWSRIRHHKEMLMRRSCIGKPVDMDELEGYSRACEELDQFSIGILDFDRINQILDE